MIKLIYGPKGFGKTKIMKEQVNVAAEKALGNVVLITDKKGFTADINLNVRCVYTEEYGVGTLESFLGFIKGLLAGNSDIEYIFIDGISVISHAAIKDLKPLFDDLAYFNDVKFVLTITAARDELPDFMVPYID